MSDEISPERAARRKRVQALKRIIILALVISILVPTVLCVILFIKVSSLESSLEQMSQRLLEVSEQVRLAADVSYSGALQEDSGASLQGAAEAGAGLPVQNQAAGDGGSFVSAGDVSGNLTASGRGQEEPALHKVYLTFDDGPSIYTEDILDILDRYGVKATFFVLGKEDEDSQKALRDIVDRGHTLGMHSYTHRYEDVYRSVEDFAEDFRKLQDYLYEVTGVRSTYYRFPGGSSNTVSRIDMQEFADYLEEEDTEFYDWNISSGDGASRQLSVETLLKNCTQGIEERETSVILMHDSAQKRTTIEALPMIIENILAMEDTVILPITEETKPVQHIQKNANE